MFSPYRFDRLRKFRETEKIRAIIWKLGLTEQIYQNIPCVSEYFANIPEVAWLNAFRNELPSISKKYLNENARAPSML